MTSFSLSLGALNWIYGFPRGERSAEVNRAILFYADHGAVAKSRDKLQELVYEYSEEITSLKDEIQSLTENIEVIG